MCVDVPAWARRRRVAPRILSPLQSSVLFFPFTVVRRRGARLARGGGGVRRVVGGFGAGGNLPLRLGGKSPAHPRAVRLPPRVIHPSIHSSIHPFIHPSIHPFIHSTINSLVRWFVGSLVRLFA